MTSTTMPAPLDGRLFYPTEDTAVFLTSDELPARYPLVCLSNDGDGLLVVMLIFRSGLSTAERVQWVRRVSGDSSLLTPELAEAVADEITRTAPENGVHL
jgi:hypothetical protein